MRGKLVICLAILTAVFISTSAFAEIQLKGGFYERIRHEYWRNNRDMNSDTEDSGDRNYFRFKTSLWGQMDMDENTNIYAKLTNENKSYTHFGRGPGLDKEMHYDIDETVVDNIYLDLKKLFDSKLDLRVGRQDLLNLYGENFIFADGTPLDGSRTFYFNAAKASWTLDEKNTLDLLYIVSTRAEEFLPVINHNRPRTALNISDEEAFAIILKDKNFKGLYLEPYYIFKKEDDEGGSGLQRQNSDLNTLGAFAKYSMDPLTFRGQLAYQSGDYGSDDRNAVGGYFFVDKDFKDVDWAPKASLGYVYLSGDDPGTADNEGWDPLFSRFPLYSEIMATSFSGESGAGYWTNLQIYKAAIALKPSQKIKLNFAYNYLRANDNIAPSATYSFSGAGKKRGQLWQGKFDYTFNKNVTTYFLAEYLDPDNFYSSSADPAIFLRTQVEIKF